MSSKIDVDESATVYGIPRSHWHCYISNFDWDGNEGKRENLLGFMADMKIRARRKDQGLSAKGDPPHIIMTGPPGRGKSHLSVGLYRWAALLTNLGSVGYVHVPSFCDKVKKSFGDSGTADPFQSLEGTDFLLVLDDLLGRNLTSWESEQVLSRLIMSGYRNGAAMVVTMNQDIELLGEVLSHHEMSRLMQNAVVWKFAGPDRRTQR